MKERHPDPTNTIGKRGAKGGHDGDHHGEQPEPPMEQSPTGTPAVPHPDALLKTKEKNHPGYAEMNSGQRSRWDQASSEVDGEEAVWGTNAETHHVDEHVAQDDRDLARRGPDTGAKKIKREG